MFTESPLTITCELDVLKLQASVCVLYSSPAHNIGRFEFDRVEIFQGISPPETAHFVWHSKGLAIWNGLSDIGHIKVNYGW